MTASGGSCHGVAAKSVADNRNTNELVTISSHEDNEPQPNVCETPINNITSSTGSSRNSPDFARSVTEVAQLDSQTCGNSNKENEYDDCRKHEITIINGNGVVRKYSGSNAGSNANRNLVNADCYDNHLYPAISSVKRNTNEISPVSSTRPKIFSKNQRKQFPDKRQKKRYKNIKKPSSTKEARDDCNVKAKKVSDISKVNATSLTDASIIDHNVVNSDIQLMEQQESTTSPFYTKHDKSIVDNTHISTYSQRKTTNTLPNYSTCTSAPVPPLDQERRPISLSAIETLASEEVCQGRGQQNLQKELKASPQRLVQLALSQQP